jgi:hypothetical protein
MSVKPDIVRPGQPLWSTYTADWANRIHDILWGLSVEGGRIIRLEDKNWKIVVEGGSGRATPTNLSFQSTFQDSGGNAGVDVYGGWVFHYPNRYEISSQAVQVKGGTSTSPYWVYVEYVIGESASIVATASSVNPPQSDGVVRVPLFRGYKNNDGGISFPSGAWVNHQGDIWLSSIYS